MLSFKSFLIELLNSNYEYAKHPSSTKLAHVYTFNDDDGRGYSVRIDHSPTRVANISFKRTDDTGADHDGEYAKTGDVGSKSHRVFATVKRIAADHAGEHDLIGYKFSASSEEPSRVKLYGRMTDRLGGSKSMSVNDDLHYFGIAAKRL
jgi:hypothetical protein